MQTIKFKGEKYRLLLDMDDLDDVDVTVQKDVAGTWKTLVRGMYGYGLTLSTHDPDGLEVALSNDLHEVLEDHCAEEVEDARFDAAADECEDEE